VKDERPGRDEGSLPELRRNPATGIWTILAPARKLRPGAHRGREKAEGEPCPFCPGNERMTPPEVWAEGRESGEPDSPGWRIRVFPNLYPALTPEGSKGISRGRGGARRAFGYHEVIVHTPHHDRSLASMEEEELRRLVEAYRGRYRELCGRRGVSQVMIIVNHGREAGASLPHPHAQVFALPRVPSAVREELREFRRVEGRCPLCSEAKAARREGRTVAANRTWEAFAPFASRSPYEVWLAPRRHAPDFARAGGKELEGMADMLLRVMRGLAELLEDPPYNLWLHSAPCDGKDYHYYHYHLEVVPRLTTVAGFELSTGMYIDVLPPEEAASRLKERMARGV